MQTVLSINKYITIQDGTKCLNVTHIAGYGVEPVNMLGNTMGVKAYANVLPEYGSKHGGEGIFLYTANDTDKVADVYKSVISFIRSDSQQYLDLSTVK